jgi:hypothetical protein
MCSSAFKYFLTTLVLTVVLGSQVWLSINVFTNYSLCREDFDSSNSSTVNYNECVKSINLEPYITYGCECRVSSWYTEQHVRIFNDGTVAAASLLFIAILVIETIRFLTMIIRFTGNKDYEDDIYFSDWQFSSLWGLLTIILNPNFADYLNKMGTKLLTQFQFIMILLDGFALITLYLYNRHLPEKLRQGLVYYLVFIGFFFNLFIYMLNTYRINASKYDKNNNFPKILDSVTTSKYTDNPPPYNPILLKK